MRRYVRQAKQRLGLNGRIVYIPSDPEAGIEAEVDWGGCRAIIGGKETRLKFFCMRSKFSGKHFVRCYPCEGGIGAAVLVGYWGRAKLTYMKY